VSTSFVVLIFGNSQVESLALTFNPDSGLLKRGGEAYGDGNKTRPICKVCSWACVTCFSSCSLGVTDAHRVFWVVRLPGRGDHKGMFKVS